MTTADLRKLKRRYAYEVGVLRKMQLASQKPGWREQQSGPALDRQRREVARIEGEMRGAG